MREFSSKLKKPFHARRERVAVVKKQIASSRKAIREGMIPIHVGGAGLMLVDKQTFKRMGGPRAPKSYVEYFYSFQLERAIK
jgi:PHP family Zn ribbon phosphoesterase